NRGIDITQDYEVDMLKRFQCGEVMDVNPVTITPDITIAQLGAFIAKGEETATHPSKGEPDKISSYAASLEDAHRLEIEAKDKTIEDVFLMDDSSGKSSGIIAYPGIVKALHRRGGNSTVEDVGTVDLITGFSDDDLFDL